ncbi:hypothetical protein QYM36_015013, partial [Artemia franciscana]
MDSIVDTMVNPLTNETHTFEEVASAIEKVSSSLQMEGLSNGDRVAFCVPNSIEACISLLAVSRCGATITLANPLYTHRELEHFVEVAEPTHWFCTSAVIPRISVTHGLRKIFVFDTNKETREKYVTYDELLHANVNLDFLPPKINLDDIATMPFSSGTTGLPKGVMLTHRNLLRSNMTDEEVIKIIFDKESDINYEEYKKAKLHLTSDEEDGRDPDWVSSVVVYTFFDHSVSIQPIAEVVYKSDSNDEEPTPSSKRIRDYSGKQPAASISTKPTDSRVTVSSDNSTPS